MILKRKFYTDTEEESSKKSSGMGGGTIAALGLGAGAIGGTIAGAKKYNTLKEKAGMDYKNSLDRIDKQYQSRRESALAEYIRNTDGLQKKIDANQQRLIDAKRNGGGGLTVNTDRLRAENMKLRKELQRSRQAYKQSYGLLRHDYISGENYARGKFKQEIRSAKTQAGKHGTKYGALIAAPVVALGIGKYLYDKNKQK